MDRRGILAALAAAMGAVSLSRKARAAEATTKIAHRLALHIDQKDPAIMGMALNNASNAAELFAARGESFAIELVAYGPGLHMLRLDTSPVKERLTAVAQSIPGMIFSACGNTMKGMAKAEGIDIPLVGEARIVPAGIVRLVELQEQGWSYVKP
jgi:uncharacterized protein